MLELLQYQFFINALLAALLTSISCGVIGTYVVARRMVFISGGITHASFGGIGLGYYLGIDPISGAAVFAVFTALGIELLPEKTAIREDSMIGIMWSFGMALGIICIALTPGYVPDLMHYLFGNILTVSHTYLYAMLVLNLIIILFFTIFFKEILFVAFDEEYARTQGLPTKRLNALLICLVALTMVINIRVVGIILVISLLTIPQAIANLFTRNFKTMMVGAAGCAFGACVAGLWGSYYLNLPSGACIIFCAVIIYIVLATTKYAVLRCKLAQRLSAAGRECWQTDEST